MLLTITTRYNQAASKSFLFAIAPLNSSITSGVNQQSKKATVLRVGHNSGLPPNDSKVPVAQDVVFVMTRVSNAGNWLSVETKCTGVRAHGVLFTWNSRTEVVGNKYSSGIQNAVWELRKEKDPLLPNTWNSLGLFWNFMTVIGVRIFWIAVGGKGRYESREAQLGQKTSKQVPTWRDMNENSPFVSVGLAQVIAKCRRRARETIRAGTVHTEPSTNLTSKTTVSRLLLEAKNPTNVPKWNGHVYPISFSSTRDVMLNSAG